MILLYNFEIDDLILYTFNGEYWIVCCCYKSGWGSEYVSIHDTAKEIKGSWPSYEVLHEELP